MSEEKRREARVEAKLAIRLAYGSLDEFVERYALDVSRGGIFVRTRDVQPVGTLISFDLQLVTGEKVVKGRGVVAWSAPPSAPGEPHREPGMGIRFTDLDAESRALVDLVVASRRAASGEGAPEPGAEPPRPQRVAFAAIAPRRAADRRPPAIGIDLGTSNCCFAVAEEGKARVLLSGNGRRTIPSVVAFDAHGRLLVGEAARAQLLLNPANTVFGAKRLLGRSFDGPATRACRDRFPYDIVEGSRGEAALHLAGREFTLQQISAFLLAEVREEATRALGEPVTRAVVTVPAYYGDRQRQAVREAGKLAGLEVERIVNEPTAAAVAWAHGRGLSRTVLVYDLGGGTFDASVVEIQGSAYEVLSIGGDPFLGGADFDAQLVDDLAFRFRRENGFLPPSDRLVWQLMRDAAEEAKVALSTAETARVQVPFLCRSPDGADAELQLEVTRAELEELCARLVERTVDICRETLAAKGLEPGDLHEVLLVGGQSRMPLVRRRLREVLGREPANGLHPEEAVALGAALLAESRGVRPPVVSEALAQAICVALPGGRVAPVLPRNSKLPARRAYELATARDGQRELELVVLQGDASRAEACELLGTVVVPGLVPGPAGAARVAVEFAVGPEGILRVTARDPATGRRTEARLATAEAPAEVRRRFGLPPAAAPRPEEAEAQPAAQETSGWRGLLGWTRGKG